MQEAQAQPEACPPPPPPTTGTKRSRRRAASAAASESDLRAASSRPAPPSTGTAGAPRLASLAYHGPPTDGPAPVPSWGCRLCQFTMDVDCRPGQDAHQRRSAYRRARGAR
eukprot:14945510-Alexandrium_andersonii.AAC.1